MIDGYEDIEKELDQAIKRLSRCMLLYIDSLERLDDIDACNRVSNILAKVSAVLTKLLKTRGIRLESSSSLAELLSKIDDEDDSKERI